MPWGPSRRRDRLRPPTSRRGGRWFGAAAPVGAGVAHPAAGASTVAYVGVRLNAAELADRAIWADLERMNLTAIVDRATALTEPQAVRALAGLGVHVASGGHGDWSTGD